jgi:HSP20 family molecular chaperone IbpA
MSLALRLLNDMYSRPWPTQIPTYWDAFDGVETFVKTETGYLMEVMVPGFTKETLTLDILHERFLVVNGETNGRTAVRKFSQRWLLPKDVDITTLQARVSDGILTIEMNKKETQPTPTSTHRIPIH